MSIQPSAQIPLGLVNEPPLSLPAEADAELQTPPELAAQTSGVAQLRPPVEAQLVQDGKLSMGQLAQAHRDRLEKGGSVLDIVVERGWVSADEVATLRATHGIEEPAPAPGRVDAIEPPEPVATTAPAPATPVTQTAARERAPAVGAEEQPVTVALRLTTGELITAGVAEDEGRADVLAQVVVADLTTAPDDAWPCFGGRYIRPETIVSVDLVSDDAGAKTA
jgi:hypothetical protein